MNADPASAPGVRMPAAFIGHGNPMNALEINRYTEAWQAFGEAVPRPRAILVDQRALVHQRHRRHRDAPAADHPRLLRVPAGAVRGAVPGARACPNWPRRSATSSSRPGSARTSTPGESTTAPGRCWCTPSRRVHPGRPAQRSTPTSPSTITSSSAPGSAPLRERGVLDHRQRQRRAQPGAAWTGTGRRRLRLGAALRRGRQGADADRPDRRSRPSTPTATTATPYRRLTTSSRCSTSPAWPPRPTSRHRRPGRRLRLRVAVDDGLHARPYLPQAVGKGGSPQPPDLPPDAPTSDPVISSHGPGAFFAGGGVAGGVPQRADAQGRGPGRRDPPVPAPRQRVRGLVSRLVGQTARAQAGKQQAAFAARCTERWTPGEALEVIARAGAEAASVAGSVCEWAKAQPHVRVTGGTGVSYPSVTLSADSGRDRSRWRGCCRRRHLRCPCWAVHHPRHRRRPVKARVIGIDTGQNNSGSIVCFPLTALQP